jgi:hypothetical protein
VPKHEHGRDKSRGDDKPAIAFRAAHRYSSEHDSSLYFSTRMDALKALYPESAELQGLSDETRVVVLEPLGDLPGAWQEVPESHVGIVQAGDDELRPFSPRSSG